MSLVNLVVQLKRPRPNQIWFRLFEWMGKFQLFRYIYYTYIIIVLVSYEQWLKQNNFIYAQRYNVGWRWKFIKLTYSENIQTYTSFWFIEKWGSMRRGYGHEMLKRMPIKGLKRMSFIIIYNFWDGHVLFLCMHTYFLLYKTW